MKMATFLAFVRLSAVAAACILVFGAAWGTASTVCPPAWLAWRDACYILLPDTMDWEQGQRVCDRPGTSMIVPDSQEEQDFIWQEMKAQMEKNGVDLKDQQQLWIGC